MSLDVSLSLCCLQHLQVISASNMFRILIILHTFLIRNNNITQFPDNKQTISESMRSFSNLATMHEESIRKLFIIFLYYWESSDSVTEIHSPLIWKLRLWTKCPLNLAMALIFGWINIQGTERFYEGKPRAKTHSIRLVLRPWKSALISCENRWKICRNCHYSMLRGIQNAIDLNDE